MKNVMTRAWKIARKGVKKFGGKVSEYLAQALVMAWAEVKNTKAKLVTTAGSRKHKSWVAKIVGTHAKFKFERSFVNEVDYNMSEKHFDLENGVYDVCDAGERFYIHVSGGKIERVGEQSVKALIA